MEDLRQQRLDAVAPIAVRLETVTKLPARLTIAQWAVESKWGSTPAGKANYFGIKREAAHAQFCLVPTHEFFNAQQVNAWDAEHPTNKCRNVVWDSNRQEFSVTIDAEFADYGSLEESAEDYARLITQGEPYAAAWAAFIVNGDFDALAKHVLARYATAQYGTLALEIAAQTNVTQAIARVKA